MIKKFALVGAAISLLASTAAFADVAAKPAPVAKVSQIKRARAVADARKSQNVAGLSMPVLAIGAVAVGVGIAAAAGAFHTSP